LRKGEAHPAGPGVVQKWWPYPKMVISR
jgi:hypothetical protein